MRDEPKVADSSGRTLSCFSRSAVKCAIADAISGVPVVRGRRPRKREGTGSLDVTQVVSHCPHGDRRLRTAGVDVAWRGLVLALDVLGMELKTHTYKLLMV